MLNPCYPINLRTRRRCFRGLVKTCVEYGTLPNSYIIPKSKIEKLGEDPFASGSYSAVWAGMYKKEDEDEEGKCVAIKVMQSWGMDAQKYKKVKYFGSHSPHAIGSDHL